MLNIIFFNSRKNILAHSLFHIHTHAQYTHTQIQQHRNSDGKDVAARSLA
jgi:hypothetical protein